MSRVIRTPQLEDADGLGRVHLRAWQAAYRGGLMPDEYLDSLTIEERASNWRRGLENPPRSRTARFVTVVDDEIVGFAIVGPADADESAEVGELYAINVDPDHWGTGVGTELIAAGINALTEAGFPMAILWVHPDNARACSFYSTHGWHPDQVDRQREVLGIQVPETRYSLGLIG